MTEDEFATIEARAKAQVRCADTTRCTAGSCQVVRTDVPRLLSALRSERERARNAEQDRDDARAKCETLEAEVDRLRGHLECDHCGGVAIGGDKDGRFTDGDGGTCETCGFPGSVTCDSETEPYWNASDSPDARCRDAGCKDCHEATPDAAALKETT